MTSNPRSGKLRTVNKDSDDEQVQHITETMYYAGQLFGGAGLYTWVAFSRGFCWLL